MSLLGPTGAQRRLQELTQKIEAFSPQRSAPQGFGMAGVAHQGDAANVPMRLEGKIVMPDSSETEQYKQMARQSAEAFGVDPMVFSALVEQESSWNPGAMSKKGAAGLTQLMPGTATELGIADPTDPAQSLDGGARYLRTLLNRYGGDYRKALAAYNAGPGAVDKAGGVPNYPETVAYVNRILRGSRP